MATRSVIGIYSYKWLQQVLADVEGITSKAEGFVMVWSVKISLFMFVLVDLIRFTVISAKGQEGFFTPQVDKLNKVTQG